MLVSFSNFLNHFIPFGITGKVHNGQRQAIPLGESAVNHRALYQHFWVWYIGQGSAGQCSEGVLGTFPYYKNTFHVFSTLRLEQRTLHFSANSQQTELPALKLVNNYNYITLITCTSKESNMNHS